MDDVLVVGGAGYIGSHCCKLLSEKGYRPIVFDNFSTGFRSLARWGHVVEGDLCDRNRLESIFKQFEIKCVMHFAAYAQVGESMREPAKYYGNNVCATLNLLNVMKDFNVTRFIFSSSAAIYGVPEEIPIPEEHVKKPVNPYGKSKLIVEQILEDYDHAYGIRFASLRYFNASGADIDGETGEIHDPETHLIPLAFQVAQGLRSHLDIYGTDYPTADGTCLRDYIHVTDLAWAHILAMKWLLAGNESQVFNLGNERGFSVKEIIELARKVSKKAIPVRETSRREGDPAELVASSAKIKRVLGWESKYGDIETILESAWRWHEKTGIRKA